MRPNVPCSTCQRLHRHNLNGETCEAFPRGIPREIVDGKHQHRAPFPGDRGLQYVKIKGAP